MAWYSFRHSYITYQVLDQTVSHMKLGRQCGTGIDYIQNVYYHHEPELITEELKGNRKHFKKPEVHQTTCYRRSLTTTSKRVGISCLPSLCLPLQPALWWDFWIPSPPRSAPRHLQDYLTHIPKRVGRETNSDSGNGKSKEVTLREVVGCPDP